MWFGKQCYKINHSTSKMSFLVPAFVTSVLYKEGKLFSLLFFRSHYIFFDQTAVNLGLKIIHLA